MILIYVFAILVSCASQEAASVGVCQCSTSDGGTIDLTSLDSRNSTGPAFSNVTLDGTLSYSYNPCTGFECGDSKDGAVCATGTNNTITVAGLQAGSTCVQEGSRQLAILYKSKDGTVTSRVLLVCNNDINNALVASNFNGSLHQLELQSKACCLTYHATAQTGTQTTAQTTHMTTTAPPNSSLSVGSVLLIIFFSLLLAYLVFGILYRMLVVGARGYEVLPHYEFWSSLPGLIQDGFAFTLQLIFGSPASSSRAGYSEIDSDSPRGTPYQQIPQNPQV